MADKKATNKPAKKERKASVKKAAPAKAVPETDAVGFPIVGIGASAGGLEALFTHMPADSHIAFVVIQHLSPKHKSIMSSLLAECTKMPVVDIEDGIKIEPDRGRQSTY